MLGGVHVELLDPAAHRVAPDSEPLGDGYPAHAPRHKEIAQQVGKLRSFAGLHELLRVTLISGGAVHTACYRLYTTMLSTPDFARSEAVPRGAPRDAVHKGMGRPWSPVRLVSVIDDPTRKARFAYAIRTARERRGLTPPQLARLLRIQPSTVNAWEKPDKTAAPSILDLGPLCDALGVDANLFAVLPAIPPSPVDEYLTLSPEEEAALRSVDAVSEGQPKPRGAGAQGETAKLEGAHE